MNAPCRTSASETRWQLRRLCMGYRVGLALHASRSKKSMRLCIVRIKDFGGWTCGATGSPSTSYDLGGNEELIKCRRLRGGTTSRTRRHRDIVVNIVVPNDLRRGEKVAVCILSTTMLRHIRRPGSKLNISVSGKGG